MSIKEMAKEMAARLRRAADAFRGVETTLEARARLRLIQAQMNAAYWHWETMRLGVDLVLAQQHLHDAEMNILTYAATGGFGPEGFQRTRALIDNERKRTGRLHVFASETGSRARVAGPSC